MAFSRFRYSRWDGTQAGLELTADEVLGEITDDLLYHGDLNAALRRLMQSGFRTPDGERMQGIREMLENLRRKRRDQLERYDLGGVYDDIAQELRDVVETEREALDDRLDEAGAEPGRPPAGAHPPVHGRASDAARHAARPTSPAR